MKTDLIVKKKKKTIFLKTQFRLLQNGSKKVHMYFNNNNFDKYAYYNLLKKQ